MADDQAKSMELRLHDPERDTAPYQQLAIARAGAIQAYASVESSISMLFATLLGTDFETAGIVFFRIVNTRARVVILEDLLEKRHKDRYATYWNSMVKLIRSLDAKRNEIVHWHLAHNLHIEGDRPTAHFTLIPPNFWTKTDVKTLTPNDLIEFSRKCDFVSRSLVMFFVMLTNRLPEPSPWLEIFQQPAAYPPPDNHPLARKP